LSNKEKPPVEEISEKVLYKNLYIKGQEYLSKAGTKRMRGAI
jgi:hypothetical protein